MKLYRELDEGEIVHIGDEFSDEIGNWHTVERYDAQKVEAGKTRRIFRAVPPPEWRKAADAHLGCWVSDGKQVLRDIASLKLVGEPAQKVIRPTHWMPEIIGLPEPKLPEPELPEDEIAFQKWFKANMAEGEWIARPAWKAALEHAKQVRFWDEAHWPSDH